MTDGSDETLPEEEAALHLRLWMLNEFDGEIDGQLKFHKSLVQFRNNTDMEKDDWPFIRAYRGPMDQGFSSILESYDDLELVYREKDGEIHIYRETDKGNRFVRGLKNGLRILKKDQTEERETQLELVAKANKDRIGSEIEQDDDIQELKEAPIGTEV